MVNLWLCQPMINILTIYIYDKNTPGRLRTDRYSDNAHYKTAAYGLVHISENNIFSLDTFGYSIWPFGQIDEQNETKHPFFFVRVASHADSFNPHEEMYYPISDSSYTEELNDYRFIKDTTIQETTYSEVLLLKNTWETPTIPVFFEDKYYVKDIGIVKYTLNNGYEYELIDHSLN